MFPMKKTLIRAISFFLTLSLLTGLLIPFASAIEYEGVESMTVDATRRASHRPRHRSGALRAGCR